MEFILNLLFLSDVNPILVRKGLYLITEMTIVVILTPKSPTIVDYIKVNEIVPITSTPQKKPIIPKNFLGRLLKLVSQCRNSYLHFL